MIKGKQLVSNNGWRLMVTLAILLLASFPGRAAVAESLAKRFAVHAGKAGPMVDHSARTALLQRYVIAGEGGLNRVDYTRFKAESHGSLKTYLFNLQQMNVSSLGRSEQFAFWVNIYSAAGRRIRNKVLVAASRERACRRMIAEPSPLKYTRWNEIPAVPDRERPFPEMLI